MKLSMSLSSFVSFSSSSVEDSDVSSSSSSLPLRAPGIVSSSSLTLCSDITERACFFSSNDYKDKITRNHAELNKPFSLSRFSKYLFFFGPRKRFSMISNLNF